MAKLRRRLLAIRWSLMSKQQRREYVRAKLGDRIDGNSSCPAVSEYSR